MNDLPVRKPNRLKQFDYSSANAYFITICTQKRECILGEIVGASSARPPHITLSEYGEIVKTAILSIPAHYPAILIENYVIMPNHVHLLLRISGDNHGRAMLAPTVTHVVQHFKGAVTKQAGFSFWQKSFHDHIVRTSHDYQMIWQYIETNPANWINDCFHPL